jgi:hypothetical protein
VRAAQLDTLDRIAAPVGLCLRRALDVPRVGDGLVAEITTFVPELFPA